VAPPDFDCPGCLAALPLLREASHTLDRPVLIGIGGSGGSGKFSFSAALARLPDDARIVPLDLSQQPARLPTLPGRCGGRSRVDPPPRPLRALAATPARLKKRASQPLADFIVSAATDATNNALKTLLPRMFPYPTS
jgi:hypothetical protein